MFRLIRPTILALTLSTALACGDAPPPAGPGGQTGAATVALSVVVNGTDIAGLAVEVTGPGIAAPILGELTVGTNRTATGRVTVPLGSDRRFRLRAFDVTGVETHRGERVVDVRGGTVPTITIALTPLAGGATIEARLASFVVAVSPDAITMGSGQRLRFRARITDANGDPVAVLQEEPLQWGSSNPGVATTELPESKLDDPAGTATLLARHAGAATLSAGFRGAVGTAAVTVVPYGYTAVSAGPSHSCFRGGFCVGRNQAGQLGDGTTTSRLTMVPAAGTVAFTEVSAGEDHACGIAADGSGAYCWGENRYGQLGDGSTTDRLSPVAVAGGGSFVSVAAGHGFTCALTSLGGVRCWGSNNLGQLGDNTSADRPTPAAIDMWTPLRFVALAVGIADITRNGNTDPAGHACALTDTGELFCWGHNARNQLGDGTEDTRRSPRPIGGSLRFRSVALGRGHGCAVTVAGALHCWGANADGQLGDGTTTQRSTPTLAIAATTVFTDLAAGDRHTCGISSSGTVRCWGNNDAGQLGDATTTSRPTAAEVSDAATGPVRFFDVTAGGTHSCGAAMEGGYYCWGSNTFGQLGTGASGNPRLIPTRVEPPTP